MELPQVPGLASPESDLGRLQRGRGSGWLRAVDRPDGQALLLTCLTTTGAVMVPGYCSDLSGRFDLIERDLLGFIATLEQWAPVHVPAQADDIVACFRRGIWTRDLADEHRGDA